MAEQSLSMFASSSNFVLDRNSLQKLEIFVHIITIRAFMILLKQVPTRITFTDISLFCISVFELLERG